MDGISDLHLKCTQWPAVFSNSGEFFLWRNQSSGFFSHENCLQCQSQTGMAYAAQTTRSNISQGITQKVN